MAVESSPRLKPGIQVDEPARTGPAEEALLVAALAATLVEYRTQVRGATKSAGSERVNSRWRDLTRLEQLRGQV
jgi:hypothetical protein